MFGGGNGNWSRTAEEEDGGVAVGRERLEVSGWAGHAFIFLVNLFGAIIILQVLSSTITIHLFRFVPLQF